MPKLRVVGAVLLTAALSTPLPAARPAPVTSGQAFGITLSQGGRSVSGDRFALRVPSVKGALVLTLQGIGLVGDGLEAPAILKNETDLDLLALRLDFASATETEGADPGASSRSRPLSASAVPLSWTEIRKGTESDPQRFRVSPIVFGPQTGLITVLGVVSGVARVSTFEVEGMTRLSAIEVESGGRLLLTDASGKALRVGPDGKNPQEVRNLPPPNPAPKGGPCARHVKEGRVCREGQDGSAWVLEGREVTAFDADGLQIRSFVVGTGTPTALAFGREGLLYVATYDEAYPRPGSVTVFRLF
jgi:hypothetical protein